MLHPGQEHLCAKEVTSFAPSSTDNIHSFTTSQSFDHLPGSNRNVLPQVAGPQVRRQTLKINHLSTFSTRWAAASFELRLAPAPYQAGLTPGTLPDVGALEAVSLQEEAYRGHLVPRVVAATPALPEPVATQMQALPLVCGQCLPNLLLRLFTISHLLRARPWQLNSMKMAAWRRSLWPLT